jgi:hypothetical protein
MLKMPQAWSCGKGLQIAFLEKKGVRGTKGPEKAKKRGASQLEDDPPLEHRGFTLRRSRIKMGFQRQIPLRQVGIMRI